MASDTSLERHRESVGGSEQHHAAVTAAPRVALAALLDRDDPPPRRFDAPGQREIHPIPCCCFATSRSPSTAPHPQRPANVTQVEGYPGLVVHGPLMATLLVDLLRRNLPSATLTGYRFPLFDTANFFTCAMPDEANRSTRLWSCDAVGAMTMEATAVW